MIGNPLTEGNGGGVDNEGIDYILHFWRIFSIRIVDCRLCCIGVIISLEENLLYLGLEYNNSAYTDIAAHEAELEAITEETVDTEPQDSQDYLPVLDKIPPVPLLFEQYGHHMQGGDPQTKAQEENYPVLLFMPAGRGWGSVCALLELLSLTV